MTNITYNIDCMEYMKIIPDQFYDIVFCDPPYGRNAGNMANGEGGGILKSTKLYKKSDFDKIKFTFECYKEICRISKYQFIFGVNYYDFPIPGGRSIWDKMNDGADQSNCEIISNPFDDRVLIYRYKWRGFIQGKITDKRKNEKKINPCHKPIALYKWLLLTYVKPGWKIFDSHLGSGSSRIACYDMGFDFIGCEIDKDYFDAQEERYKNHITNPELWDKKEIQECVFREDKLL